MSFRDVARLIEAITVDAYGDDEQLAAFYEVFAQEVKRSTPAGIIGVDVEVIRFDYRDERQGLVVLCRRDGVQQEVSAADLVFPPDTEAAWIHAAYRRWLGLKPHPATMPAGWQPAWL